MGSVLFGSTAQFCNVLEFGHFTPKIKTPQERTDGIDLCQIVAMLCTIFIQEKAEHARYDVYDPNAVAEKSIV